MSQQEKDFFVWWDEVQPYINSINIRQAWDAGYKAAMERMQNG